MDSSHKIVTVIVISNLEFGGAQRQIVELMNHIDRQKFDLHIVSLSPYIPLGEFINHADTNLHIIEKKYKFDLSVAWRLAKLLRHLKADIVHGYLFDAEIAARLAGLLARTRAIGNCERNADYKLKKIQSATYWLTKGLLDFCIGNSQAGCEFNQRALGNPKDMYYTIHNGVDTNRFQPRDSAQTRRDLGVDDDTFLIGMFGSFKEQKNHPMLFKAMPLILKAHPNTKLLLVGDQLAGGMHGSDEYKVNTLAMAKNLGLEPHCIFVGNRGDVEVLYPACDLTVLPSLFEGTPNVALESMASGVPIVATGVADNAVIIKDGSTGYIVTLHDHQQLADKVNLLLQDSPLRLTMGKQARQHMLDEYSCQRLAEKTASVYTDVLGHTKGAAAKLKSFQ